ncbi:hypothetical protein [Paracoccus aminophilus]|uniref:hypothetical protein n=1 Tax=Paracoccus aminophilus TaxID=34003 RepID=UPI0005A257BA|nr:hypothetical protein [Paracoccus aminophilus]
MTTPTNPTPTARGIARDQLAPEVLRAVERAEVADRVRYGAGVFNGRPVFVDVSFYPRRQWWLIEDGERAHVTVEIARQVEGLKL